MNTPKYLKKYLPFYIALFFLPTSSLFAARFVIQNDSANKSVNDTLRATVYIDTEGDTINNGEGTLTFPKDKVRVESISTSGSIFSLWVEQPDYSNQNGTVTFNGGVPNPGYTGSSGRLFQITFRAIDAGNGSFTITNSSILSNDGLGTDVSRQSSPNPFSIVQTEKPIEEKPTPVTKPTQTESTTESTKLSLLVPVIVSKDIPDQTKWYSIDSAAFSWTLPKGVTSVFTSLDTNSKGTPTKEYTPAIKEKTLTKLDDGKQYLHIRFSGNGTRSSVGTYAINIDTTSPSSISVAEKKSTSGGTHLSISASDELSGINYYAVSLDGKSLAKIQAGTDPSEFILPATAPGTHDLVVQAYDKANNVKEKTVTLTTGELDAPTISPYPQSKIVGSALTIVGTSGYSKSTVRVWTKQDTDQAKPHDVETDALGNFTYVEENIASGSRISAYAEVVYNADIKSPPSDEVVFVIAGETKSIPMVLMIGVLLLAFFYICYIKIQLWKLRLEKNLDLTSIDINDELSALSVGIKDYFKILRLATKKGHMTRDEEVELLALFNDLSKTHTTLSKKLRKGTRISKP